MTTLLIFPPATDPAHPPLGIPSLAAYAVEQGEEVRLLDLNVLSYYWLLSPENLDRCSERLEHRIAEMEEGSELAPDEITEYRRSVPSYLSAQYLRERINDVIAAFRRPTTYRDLEIYQRTMAILRRAMRLVSAAYYPLEWAPRSMLMGYLPTRSSDVLKATVDCEKNPFLPYFEAHMGRIEALDPSILGISVNFYSQLIPGMTLAAMLKRKWPDRPVVVGGGLVGFFCSDWDVLRPFRGIVDAFVPFEGERPLLGLIRAWKRGERLSLVPGVLCFDGGGGCYSPPEEPVCVVDLPPPDYEDLPLDLYLSPETVLLMQTSRGCYWGRCTFCSHSHLYRGRFGKKEGEVVASEMRTLSKRFGARRFYFTDECIPPSSAVRIAECLGDGKDGLSWFGEMRFERSLDPSTIEKLARGGAGMLMFGLESGCPRVLQSMEKGTDLEDASAILNTCHANGIRAFVMLFIGFPRETYEEAEETLHFLLRHHLYIRHIAATKFVLEHQSPVYQRAESFGVIPLPNLPAEDLKTFSDYEVDAGLNLEEAREFVCELRSHAQIKKLADQNVLSRTHFLFLPASVPDGGVSTERLWPESIDTSRIWLHQSENLVSVTLPFSFDEIQKLLHDNEPAAVPSRPTSYVFSLEQERLLDVGEDGLLLLRALRRPVQPGRDPQHGRGRKPRHCPGLLPRPGGGRGARLERSSVSIVLVYPPAADPSQPYSSLPALSAALRNKGWDSVYQMDLNIELCRELLRREALEQALNRVQERIERFGIESGGTRETYGYLVRATLTGPFVADEIEGAVEELKRIDCYKDPKRLDRAKRSVFDALHILSASSDYLCFDPKAALNRCFGSLDEIATAVEYPENPFPEFFRRRALPRIRDLSPLAVGISLTYHSQIVAAFTLAREIREALPGTKLVLGGQVVSHWYETLPGCPELFDWFDYLVAFEGETALDALLAAIRDGRTPEDVPNLIWSDCSRVKSNRTVTEDIDALPTPDYRGLPLDEYITPEPVFLLSTSRGCYWGRCAFCSVSPAFRGRHRTRDPDLVHRDIQTLAKRHGARYLAFGDDCISPRMLRELTRRLETGPKLYWQCEVRFESGITNELLEKMRRAGCVNLIFGLESYSPRVLRSMDKGVTRADIDRILENCRSLKITFNLQFFFGFPGETQKEAETTSRYVLRQARGNVTFSYGLFNLVRGSRVEQDPGSFGIEKVDRSTGSLTLTYPFEPGTPHARVLKSELQQKLRKRFRFPHIGLSLTAQSLIYFAEAAATDGVDLYLANRKKNRPGPSFQDPCELDWSRVVRVSVGRFGQLPLRMIDDCKPDGGEPVAEDGYLLAYDRDQDRIVTLSPLALWLLERLDGSVRTRELVDEFSAAASSDRERSHHHKALLEALTGLASHGFVTPIKEERADHGCESCRHSE